MSDYYPFTFSMSMAVGASDNWGSHTPRMAAQNGNLYGIENNAMPFSFKLQNIVMD